MKLDIKRIWNSAKITVCVAAFNVATTAWNGLCLAHDLAKNDSVHAHVNGAWTMVGVATVSGLIWLINRQYKRSSNAPAP